MRRFSPTLFALAPLVTILVSGNADAATQKPMSKNAVKAAVQRYAKARGIRVVRMSAAVSGLSDSEKSTRAIVGMDGREVELTINHATGRVQSAETAKLVDAMLVAHVPYARAGKGVATRFATEVLAFSPGEGVTAPRFTIPTVSGAPVGRPRAGQTTVQLALDAKSLGRGGSITVGFDLPVIAGRPGAGFRVTESGVGSNGTIVNQTPAMVEAVTAGKTYRLGHAGYQMAGDVLFVANALDKIPAGTPITALRITDDPSAPHPHGIDPTDNALAAARGVGGFDLVSAEALPGRSPAKRKK